MGQIGEMGDMLDHNGEFMGHNGETEKMSGVFEVDESSGEIRILRHVAATDTPRGIYELLLRATDYGVFYIFFTCYFKSVKTPVTSTSVGL